MAPAWRRSARYRRGRRPRKPRPRGSPGTRIGGSLSRRVGWGRAPGLCSGVRCAGPRSPRHDNEKRGKAPVHRSVPAALIATLLATAVASATPGTVDTTFGTSGKVITSFGSGSADIYALVLQPDSKIVVAGWDSNLAAFALARYGTNGSLDTTFGTSGKVTTVLG